MRKKSLLLFLCLASFFVSYAQTHSVSGTIKDEGGLPLPGVNIIEKEAQKGTVTDMDGKFVIQATKADHTLVVSFIGFETQEVDIEGRSVINITMKENVTVLNEVVTTAKFISREKKSVGYALQSLKGEDISFEAEPNLVQGLAGKIAGVQITGGTSGMGGSSNIIIRGNTNLSGNNLPLFVIDGVPFYNDEVDKQSFWDAWRTRGTIDWGDPISKVNPEDIEEITVLKGAGATALYGSRASNGVILISTKKGKGIKKGAGINYSYGMTFSNPANLPDYQQEYGAGNNGVYEYRGDRNNPGTNELTQNSWGPKFDPQLYLPQFRAPVINGQVVKVPWISHPDNVTDFWRTGILKEHNLSMSFGGEDNYGRVSLRHADEAGMIPETDEARNGLTANYLSTLSKKWKAEFMINYNESSSDNRVPGYGDGIIQNLIKMPSNYDMKYINSIPHKRPDGSQVKWLEFDNPYWTLNEDFNKYKRYNLTASTGLRYAITDWLEAKVSVSKNLSNGEYASFTEIDAGLTSSGSFWNDGGYSVSSSTHNENNYDFMLFGKRKLMENLDLSFNLGANQRKTYDSNWSSSVSELATPGFANLGNGVGDKQASQSYSEKETQSVFGLMSFGYNDYLYVDLTGRNDWSSTLPKQNRSYFYPAASMSFLITEAFNIESKILSFGKLRASWAQVGADTAPYQLAGTYGAGDPWDGKQTNAYTSTLPPTDLKPQRTNSLEVGTELNFFDNRLNFDLAFYKTNTRNQIVTTGIPRESGFSYATINAGDVQNKGVELMLNATLVRNKNFQWNLIANASKNENKLVELPDEIKFVRTSWGSMEIRVVEGELYGEMYGYSYVKNPDGRNIIMDNGKPYRSQDYPNMSWDQHIGNAMPKVLGGVTNSIRYKEFRLSATLSGRFGGDIYSMSDATNMSRGLLQETVGLNDKGIEKRLPVSQGGGVRADGVVEVKDESGNVTGYEENQTYVEAQDYYGWLGSLHEEHVFDASYLKLQSVVLTYRFPKKYIKPLKVIQGITLSGSLYNVATLVSHIPNVDPEASLGRTNAGSGMESGALPSPRRINFKLSVNF